ncbi:MAG: 4-hydroxy-tetrahydrodipicolinate reductase, partial [Chitinophagaceae bacterium]|nr:4-hydroxy-tetrahydrodipicolinate reductase [Chitinophagaceae bacterium]
IVLKIGSGKLNQFTNESLQYADVCVEFSTPETAFDNVSRCLRAGKPTICGSTAWLQKLDEAYALCIEQQTAFLYASNFSIGVNLFFKINEYAARLMSAYPLYNVRLEEIHHTAKKDAPSGTAVTLAEGILKYHPDTQQWVSGTAKAGHELSIVSKRIDPAPGTHSIFYESDIDSIELKHTAHSRMGFAHGAVLAAEFVCGKKGIFTMKDVLD